MFITNNHPPFYFWSKENLVKYQKVSKYYVNDCSSRKIVSSSSKAILAHNSNLFKHLLTDLTILSNIPPHEGEIGGLKCHFKP